MGLDWRDGRDCGVDLREEDMGGMRSVARGSGAGMGFGTVM